MSIYGPQLVAPAPAAVTSELRPFVLKCPECGAPQPGPQSTCRYCKVPLMWAPSSSLSRDDLRALALDSGAGIEDEPDTRLLCFGPTGIAPNADAVFTMMPQVICRPTHLWLSSKTAVHLYVRSLTVGATMLLSANAPALMSGELFARGRGLALDSDTIHPGLQCRLVVANGTPVATSVEGAIRVSTRAPTPTRAELHAAAHPADYFIPSKRAR